MDGLWEKRGNAAYPCDERSWRFLHKLPDGARFMVKVHDPSRRSAEMHKLCFSVMHKLFDNQEKYTSFESFRAHLLVYLGFYEDGNDREGKQVVIPRSLAYGAMRADEFAQVTDAVLDFAESMGFDRAELLAQTREFAA